MSLYPEEYDAIASELPNVEILAGGIIKLFFASPVSRRNRTKAAPILSRYKDSISDKFWVDAQLDGGIVLTQTAATDRNDKFMVSFQIFHLDTFKRRFKYELYFGMRLFKVNENFYVTELDDCMAGLLFSSSRAAALFARIFEHHSPTQLSIQNYKIRVKAILAAQNVKAIKNKAAIKKKSSGIVAAAVPTPVGPLVEPDHMMTVSPMPLPREHAAKPKAKGKRAIINREPKPSPVSNNLNNVQEPSYDVTDVPESWKGMLTRAGLNEADMKDKNVMTNVVRVIENEAMTMSIKNRGLSLAALNPGTPIINESQREEFRLYNARQAEKRDHEKKLDFLVGSIRDRPSMATVLPPPVPEKLHGKDALASRRKEESHMVIPSAPDDLPLPIDEEDSDENFDFIAAPGSVVGYQPMSDGEQQRIPVERMLSNGGEWQDISGNNDDQDAESKVSVSDLPAVPRTSFADELFAARNDLKAKKVPLPDANKFDEVKRKSLIGKISTMMIQRRAALNEDEEEEGEAELNW